MANDVFFEGDGNGVFVYTRAGIPRKSRMIAAEEDHQTDIKKKKQSTHKVPRRDDIREVKEREYREKEK